MLVVYILANQLQYLSKNYESRLTNVKITREDRVGTFLLRHRVVCFTRQTKYTKTWRKFSVDSFLVRVTSYTFSLRIDVAHFPTSELC